MNLHTIASGVIGSVNESIPVTVQINTGYTTDVDGTRTPTYVYHQDILAQIQALTYDELKVLDGLNIQGERRAIYLNGTLYGLSRTRNMGGDMITFPEGQRWPYGTIWLIILVSEQWDNWCKVAATLQNGS